MRKIIVRGIIIVLACAVCIMVSAVGLYTMGCLSGGGC
jgi:hypothetical protein